MATLLVVAGGLFGPSKMVPDPQAGFVRQADGSFTRDLKIGAELVIAADGKTTSLRTVMPAQKGGALTRAISAAQQPPQQEALVTAPLLQVGEGAKLQLIPGAGWTFARDGWVMVFLREDPTTKVVLELWIPADDPRRLEVRPQTSWDFAFIRVLYPRSSQQICPNPNCGVPISAGAKFCRKCGTKL